MKIIALFTVDPSTVGVLQYWYMQCTRDRIQKTPPRRTFHHKVFYAFKQISWWGCKLDTSESYSPFSLGLIIEGTIMYHVCLLVVILNRHMYSSCFQPQQDPRMISVPTLWLRFEEKVWTINSSCKQLTTGLGSDFNDSLKFTPIRAVLSDEQMSNEWPFPY